MNLLILISETRTQIRLKSGELLCDLAAEAEPAALSESLLQALRPLPALLVWLPEDWLPRRETDAASGFERDQRPLPDLPWQARVPPGWQTWQETLNIRRVVFGWQALPGCSGWLALEDTHTVQWLQLRQGKVSALRSLPARIQDEQLCELLQLDPPAMLAARAQMASPWAAENAPWCSLWLAAAPLPGAMPATPVDLRPLGLPLLALSTGLALGALLALCLAIAQFPALRLELAFAAPPRSMLTQLRPLQAREDKRLQDEHWRSWQALTQWLARWPQLRLTQLHWQRDEAERRYALSGHLRQGQAPATQYAWSAALQAARRAGWQPVVVRDPLHDEDGLLRSQAGQLQLSAQFELFLTVTP